MRGLKRHLDDGGNTSTLVIWGTWQMQVSPGRERSYKRILSCRMECAMPLDRYEHWRGMEEEARGMHYFCHRAPDIGQSYSFIILYKWHSP